MSWDRVQPIIWRQTILERLFIFEGNLNIKSKPESRGLNCSSVLKIMRLIKYIDLVAELFTRRADDAFICLFMKYIVYIFVEYSAYMQYVEITNR